MEMRILIEKHWLLLIAGAIWTAVGILLCKLAYGWLSAFPIGSAGIFALIGAGGSLAVYRFGFSRTVAKNIRRIGAMSGKVSPLAFQTARSYVLVVFMMGLGIALRGSPIPKPYLASLYVAIGGGLFWSSFGYYAELARVSRLLTLG